MTAVTSEIMLIAAGAGFAIACGILGAGVLASAPRERALKRIGLLEQRAPYRETSGTALLRSRSVSDIALVDALLRGKAWVARVELELDRAGWELRAGEYLFMRAIVVALGVLGGMWVVRLVQGPQIAGALIGLGAGYLVPRFVIGRVINRRSARVEGQLVELCDLMSSMLRSGFGYMQAIATTAEQLGDPLGSEMRRVLDSVRLGMDIDEAFEELNRRLSTPDFMVLTTAIGIQRRTGGNLAEILDGVAETIRDRQALRQEIAALTAMEQATAAFAAAFPLGLAAVLMLVSPDPFRMLVTDSIGRLFLVGALILDGAGFLVMRRVTRLKA